MKKTMALALAALTAGVYFLPLCPNFEMLSGGKADLAMCAKAETCCAEESAAPPSCCDTTILAFERRDGVSTDAPLLALPALAAVSWPDAAALFSEAAASFVPPFRGLSPPPLLLSLRL